MTQQLTPTACPCDPCACGPACQCGETCKCGEACACNTRATPPAPSAR